MRTVLLCSLALLLAVAAVQALPSDADDMALADMDSFEDTTMFLDMEDAKPRHHHRGDRDHPRHHPKKRCGTTPEKEGLCTHRVSWCQGSALPKGTAGCGPKSHCCVPNPHPKTPKPVRHYHHDHTDAERVARRAARRAARAARHAAFRNHTQSHVAIVKRIPPPHPDDVDYEQRRHQRNYLEHEHHRAHSLIESDSGADAEAEAETEVDLAAMVALSSCSRPIGASPKTITIPASIVSLANAHTHPAYTAKRGTCPSNYIMTAANAQSIIQAAWTAFGATSAQASQYAARNLKQAKRESSLCPAIVQGIIAGDPNNNNPAGGMFQFIQSTFNVWAVRGYTNRYNPLHNALAAVNAQVNAKCIYPAGQGRVLQGTSGWTPSGGSNPFK